MRTHIAPVRALPAKRRFPTARRSIARIVLHFPCSISWLPASVVGALKHTAITAKRAKPYPRAVFVRGGEPAEPHHIGCQEGGKFPSFAHGAPLRNTK